MAPSDIAPRIKVCGLRSVENALACAQAGANWIGLNFHPRSPRFVEPEVAAEIVSVLPPDVEAVGLFVDRPPDEVRSVAESVGLRLLQLHGNEPVETLRELSDFRLVRAFRLGDVAAVDQMSTYLRRLQEIGVELESVLIDAFVPGREGGTGASIASPILDALPRIPRLILAGGLTPENVRDRVERVRPWMVDVASGVESAPGVKDPELVRRFVASARSVGF